MKLTLVRSKAILLMVAMLIMTAVIVLLHARHLSEAESGPVAVGLRGANRVSKPMSARQRDRFDNYFLGTPAVPQNTSSNATPSAVSQAQAVNAFNRNQNQ